MKTVHLSVLVVVVLWAAGVLAEHAQDPPAVELVDAAAAANSNLSTTIGRPVDCADYLTAGATASGVYEIYPFTCTCARSVKVWCDMETDGGGWTVFLKRQKQTNQLDFNRTWEEYKGGFGSPEKEYWLGNEIIHQMTFSRKYAIRLDVRSVSGTNDFSTYPRFQVDDEDSRYLTSVSGTIEGGSNTIKYCFYYFGGRHFTTLDRDYDSYSGNCAAMQGGGWWHYNCRSFSPTSTYKNTISLFCHNSYRQSMTDLELKIRPAICDSSFKTIHLKGKSCGCEGTV